MLLALVLALATDGLLPLNDLGAAPYNWGYFGGLYEDGSNTIPADHLAAGLRRAALIRPLGGNGIPSPNGKVVFLSVGFGETARIADSFQAMAASGSGGLGTVSAGIAEALITTAFGLLVALPAVMMFNYFTGWIEARGVDMAESANEFLDLVATKLKQEAVRERMHTPRHELQRVGGLAAGRLG